MHPSKLLVGLLSLSDAACSMSRSRPGGYDYPLRVVEGYLSPVDPFLDSLDTTKDVCVLAKDTKSGLITPAALRKQFEAALEQPR